MIANRISSESDPVRKAKLEKFQTFMEQSERDLQASLAEVKADMEQMAAHNAKLNIRPPLERFGDITSQVMLEQAGLITQIAECMQK